VRGTRLGLATRIVRTPITLTRTVDLVPPRTVLPRAVSLVRAPIIPPLRLSLSLLFRAAPFVSLALFVGLALRFGLALPFGAARVVGAGPFGGGA
jgi:hypothetical protein